MTTFAIDPSEKFSGYALAHGREVLWYGETTTTIRALDQVINELRRRLLAWSRRPKSDGALQLVAERMDLGDPKKAHGVFVCERAVGRWELALEQAGYLAPLGHVDRIPIPTWHKYVRDQGFKPRESDGRAKHQKAALRLLRRVRPQDAISDKHHNAACAAAIALACESKRAGGDLFAWAT